MASCKLVNFLYDAIPVRIVRDYLLRSHIEGCARCQAALLSRDEAKALFVSPADAGGTEEIWRRLSQAGERVTGRAEEAAVPRGPRSMRWQWAAGAAATIALAAVSFWLLENIQGPGTGSPGAAPARDGFEIKYVNIGGEPAQTFIYQPQGSETIFVWASKTP